MVELFNTWLWIIVIRILLAVTVFVLEWVNMMNFLSFWYIVFWLNRGCSLIVFHACWTCSKCVWLIKCFFIFTIFTIVNIKFRLCWWTILFLRILTNFCIMPFLITLFEFLLCTFIKLTFFNRNMLKIFI